MSLKIELRSLAQNWPSSIVCREEVGRFSGGVLNPKTLANLDACGRGPTGRFRIGRRIELGRQGRQQHLQGVL